MTADFFATVFLIVRFLADAFLPAGLALVFFTVVFRLLGDCAFLVFAAFTAVFFADDLAFAVFWAVFFVAVFFLLTFEAEALVFDFLGAAVFIALRVGFFATVFFVARRAVF
ncbi:hypothetical protein JXA32_10650 [Candidatus Sumerlaeota bacterium]|nr:hypothetical protein [Candidatus Sumerlaeota bacterium]